MPPVNVKNGEAGYRKNEKKKDQRAILQVPCPGGSEFSAQPCCPEPADQDCQGRKDRKNIGGELGAGEAEEHERSHSGKQQKERVVVFSLAEILKMQVQS